MVPDKKRKTIRSSGMRRDILMTCIILQNENLEWDKNNNVNDLLKERRMLVETSSYKPFNSWTMLRITMYVRDSTRFLNRVWNCGDFIEYFTI